MERFIVTWLKAQEIGEMEVQSKNALVREVDLDVGCIPHTEEYIISNGVEVVEGPSRRNSKDGNYIPGNRASSDVIVKMRSRVRRLERKIKKKKKAYCGD
ncbi:hypothetical protein RHMOL_Rhmol05G0121200 [Rhododendron molle]|uniref:Uncharacterized protein n=1 Tax=Rhododendron molle TaxID=49168 RepID=A0ACC0NPC1_RHOML|nr:hypothetical protein RHMOL_Rhmol05G0121200 [Rhododendron molle]